MIKNIAHRGFSGNYPENTMLAFRKAIETEGCDGIEMDVHLSRDGEAVIIHDEKIDRTCVNGTGFVKDYTAEELNKFDVSYIFAGQCEPQHIPTLREYFELVKDKDIVTNIELKTSILEYPGIEEKVWELIQEYGLKEKIFMSSFNHYSIARMKALCPDLECGLLTESWLFQAGRYTRMCGAECYHPAFISLSKEVVAEIHKNGIKINAWTINEEEDIRKMIKLGIDGIIGNYPDRVAKILREA